MGGEIGGREGKKKEEKKKGKREKSIKRQTLYCSVFFKKGRRKGGRR